jgi:predicted MFS family arabinose efflux permease
MGIIILIVGVWALLQDPSDKNAVIQHKKIILRKRYGLFYFLTFMSGARRQIFVAFASLLLVKKFGFNVQQIAILFIINNIINYFLSPVIGKCITLFGERRVLSLEYFSLLFIFTAYVFTESKIIISLLYILDHIFFNFAIAIRTYFQKVADSRDIAPSMAVAATINHIAAVILPVLGGYLWIVSYKIPFLAGAVMSLVSLIAVQFIRTRDE